MIIHIKYVKIRLLNGTFLLYEGWIEVEFSLPSNKDFKLTLPILVTNYPLNTPIIGTNVINNFTQTNMSTDSSKEMSAHGGSGAAFVSEKNKISGYSWRNWFCGHSKKQK